MRTFEISLAGLDPLIYLNWRGRIRNESNL